MDGLIDAWAPRILVAGVRDRPFPWRKPWRRLPCWLLVCSLDGPESVRIDGGVIAIPSGGAYVLAPDTAHALESPGNRPAFVHLELVAVPGRGRPPAEESWPSAMPPPAGMAVQPAHALGAALPVVVPPAWTVRFRRALPRIAAAWESGDALARVRSAMEAATLLVDWAATIREPGGDDPLRRAEHAARNDLAAASLRRMAAAAGLGISRFCERYTADRGRTPGAFIRDARLAQARELLAETALPLAEIAARCGWANPSVLVRAFRAAHGLTPAAWRRDQASAGSSGSRAHTRSR